MQPVPLPAPYGGINELVPVIALESPQCQNLFNFNTTETGVILRKGDQISRSVVTTGTILSLHHQRLFNLAGDIPIVVFYDITAGFERVVNVLSGALIHSVAQTGATPAVCGDLYFNNRHFVFIATGAARPGFVYDVTAGTWGAIGYTTGTTFSPVGGNSYRNRAYIVDLFGFYWYSDVDAISGALTKVDITSLTRNYAALFMICAFTLSDQIASVLIQTFIFDNGEVLFYTGTYPNGPDWTQVGRAEIGRPLNRYSSIAYQGDYLILTDTGIFSLRELFLKGSQSARVLTSNAKVEKTWRKMMVATAGTATVSISSYLRGDVRGVYDKLNNRIIISFPFYLDTAGSVQPGSFYFVFDSLREAWNYQRSYGVVVDVVSFTHASDIIFSLNQIYFSVSKFLANGTITVCTKESSAGFVDRLTDNSADVGYSYEVVSAPISIDRAYVQQLTGMDIFAKTDLQAESNFSFIKDLGVNATVDQKIPVYGSSADLQKPMVNAGIEGSYVQYRIRGTTSSGKNVGLELYGTTMWIDQGKSPR